MNQLFSSSYLLRSTGTRHGTSSPSQAIIVHYRRPMGYRNKSYLHDPRGVKSNTRRVAATTGAAATHRPHEKERRNEQTTPLSFSPLLVLEVSTAQGRRNRTERARPHTTETAEAIIYSRTGPGHGITCCTNSPGILANDSIFQTKCTNITFALLFSPA